MWNLKGRRFGRACVAATLVASTSLTASVAAPAAPDSMQAPAGDMRFLPSVKIPMRDGIKLSTDIYLPMGIGPFPIILTRTPYSKKPNRPAWVSQSTSSVDPRTATMRKFADFFVHAGYAVVVQDIRGKFESDGVSKLARYDRSDFEDTAKWLDTQPWSARRMGMWGCSYGGITQSVAAVTGVHSLNAVNPNNSGGSFQNATIGRYNNFGTGFGGARFHDSMLQWFTDSFPSLFLKPDQAFDAKTWARYGDSYHLEPVSNVDSKKLVWDLPLLGVLDRAGLPPTDFNIYVSSPPESKYWQDDVDLINVKDKIYTPALWIQNWNDFLSGEGIDSLNWAKKNAANATARDNQYMIMGPGPHCYTSFDRGRENEKIDDLELGDTRLPIWDIVLKWNNRWVKGDVHALEGMPKVTYWLYGKNEWRTSTEMPLPGTRYQNLYLSSRKGANSLQGDGTLSFNLPRTSSRDTYRYNPADPVRSGDIESWGVPLSDQRATEARKDVLVYTTEPLKQGLTVVGPIKMVLTVSSSAVDTDFTGKLVDVYPDGRAIQLQHGILRVRYRNNYLKPEMMVPGKTYQITVDMNATGNWFAPGHRIRLEVSSSNFPWFDRNLNTGGDTYSEAKGVVAQNTIISGPSTPSHLILPIAPD